MNANGLRAIFNSSELKNAVCEVYPTCNGIVVTGYNGTKIADFLYANFPNYELRMCDSYILVTLSENNTGCPKCGYHLAWIRVIYDYDGKITKHETVITGKVHQMRTENKCQACGCDISKPVAGHEEIKPDVTLGSS